MKILFKAKDGGPESLVTGYWLFESKRLGSIVLLRFDQGSREAYHTHAFNALSWVLRGKLREVLHGTEQEVNYTSSVKPILTPRARFHRVFGEARRTWVLSFRGPWVPYWREYLPSLNKYTRLSNGRVVHEDSTG